MKDTDIEVLRADGIALGYHLQFFKERLSLWEYVKVASVPALDSLLATFLKDFIHMYRSHSKGKDKHTQLLLDWYKYVELYSVKGSQTGEAA